MDIEFKDGKKCLFVILKGELDHNFLKNHRERIEMKIATTQKETVVLNLDFLSFMDSSGISLVYDAYKTSESAKKKLTVVVNNEKYKKILTLAKMEKFVKISDKYEEGK